jgi:hypothetical protein
LPDTAVTGRLRAGQLAKIDGSDRLSVPLEVLRATDWWADKPVDVVAEIVHEGLIRVYLAQEATPLVEALSNDLADLPGDLRFERMAVLADRYRPLKLYGDGRLRFTKETAQILGFALGERPTLFVQPFPKGFEILSLRFRAERLQRNTGSTSLSLYQAG